MGDLLYCTVPAKIEEQLECQNSRTDILKDDEGGDADQVQADRADERQGFLIPDLPDLFATIP